MYRKKKKNQKFIIMSIVAVVLVILLSISLLTTRSQNTILKSIGIGIQKVVMYPFTTLNKDKGETASESYLIQKNVNSSLEKEIKELKDKRNSVREIAKILGISKTKVGRLV